MKLVTEEVCRINENVEVLFNVYVPSYSRQLPRMPFYVEPCKRYRLVTAENDLQLWDRTNNPKLSMPIFQSYFLCKQGLNEI